MLTPAAFPPFTAALPRLALARTSSPLRTRFRLTLYRTPRYRAQTMSSIGTGYDQSTTTYSPDGRVFQVEYAAKAVEGSSTAVGIRCKDGVAMAVEKPKLSKMMVEGSNRRIFSMDKHSGLCVSGMIADARQIVNHGRYEASRYMDFYGCGIPGQVLCDRIAGLMHNYTLYWYALFEETTRGRCTLRRPSPSPGILIPPRHATPCPLSESPPIAPERTPARRVVRPFGCSVLIGSYTEDGPQLHAVRTPPSSPRASRAISAGCCFLLLLLLSRCIACRFPA